MKYIVLSILLYFSILINLFCQVSTEELIVYYPFNGNANDESGNRNHGTVHGATLTTDRFGNENSAYDFDGVDDFIEIASIEALGDLGDFSISIWFQQEDWRSTVQRQYVFNGHGNSSTSSSSFFLDGFNINLNLQNDGISFLRNSIIDLDNNDYQVDIYDIGLKKKWVHNVFIREGNHTYHYVNSALERVENNDGNILNMYHYLWLGTFAGNNPNYRPDLNFNFDGKIDDVKIYTRSLTATEVVEIYNEQQTVAIDGNMEVCQGQNNVSYTATQNANAVIYTWNYSGTGITMNTSNNQLLADFSEDASSGDLSVSVELTDGTLITSDNFPVSIQSLPSAAGEISGDTEACLSGDGKTYQIPEITNVSNYIWNYSGEGVSVVGNANSVFVRFSENSSPGSLSVYGANDCGLGAASELAITLKNCNLSPGSLRIPNSFTPNGDGINERFVIDGLNENTSLQIFNRYGKKLYESNNYQNDWDGRATNAIFGSGILPAGTYFYIVDLKDGNGPFTGYVYIKP